MTLFADGFLSKRTYTRQPAYATATLTVPSTNAFFVRPTGFAGSSYTVGYNFIDDNLPLNTQKGYTHSWEVTPGVRVKLPHDWEVEALLTHGDTHDEANSYFGTNNAALNTALASNNPATAFDPYGLHRTSQATLDADCQPDLPGAHDSGASPAMRRVSTAGSSICRAAKSSWQPVMKARNLAFPWARREATQQCPLPIESFRVTSIRSTGSCWCRWWVTPTT